MNLKFFVGTLVLFLWGTSIGMAQNKTTTVLWQDLVQLNVQTGAIPPALQKLEGEQVKIPGFIVPLDGDENYVTEFLLVPTMGACVHVPAPPPNQIVHVKMPHGLPVDMIYDPLWVTGQLRISSVQSDLAEAGFSLSGIEAEIYRR